MHRRSGEIGEAADVVEVEMGRHDVAHVGDAEADETLKPTWSSSKHNLPPPALTWSPTP